jgi:sec-independent protein translocase protein TatB
VFNLGFGELAVIFIVLIIAVGPDRLPAMMKGLGKTIRTVRQASRDIRATVGIDEMMREDVLQPLPRRPVPKAAIARPATASATLPTPAATPENAPPTENARPAEAVVAPPSTEATAAPAVPSAAPAPAKPAGEALGSATPVETPGEPAPRKD